MGKQLRRRFRFPLFLSPFSSPQFLMPAWLLSSLSECDTEPFRVGGKIISLPPRPTLSFSGITLLLAALSETGRKKGPDFSARERDRARSLNGVSRRHSPLEWGKSERCLCSGSDVSAKKYFRACMLFCRCMNLLKQVFKLVELEKNMNNSVDFVIS